MLTQSSISIKIFLFSRIYYIHVWRQANHSKYTILIAPASGAAHLSKQSRLKATCRGNQPAADFFMFFMSYMYIDINQSTATFPQIEH